ncbi:movement protein [North American maize-associated mastrevirus]|nr:movement protein [North American maize-associated mastrevirus]
MESGHLPQISPPVYFTGSASQGTNPTGVGNDAAWRFLVLFLACAAVSLGIIIFLYKTCLKDLLLTWRARRSRTVTELGFGATPQRPAGAAPPQVGQVGPYG